MENRRPCLPAIENPPPFRTRAASSSVGVLRCSVLGARRQSARLHRLSTSAARRSVGVLGARRHRRPALRIDHRRASIHGSPDLTAPVLPAILSVSPTLPARCPCSEGFNRARRRQCFSVTGHPPSLLCSTLIVSASVLSPRLRRTPTCCSSASPAPVCFGVSHVTGLRTLVKFVGGAMDGHDFPKDKLILRGLKFHGFHGVKQEEKQLGQKFLVDVDAWLDLSKAGKSDCLADTVSYTDIYRIVQAVVEGPPQNLLESVAHLIANTTLTKHPQISAVRVKVGKPHVAVPGSVDYLGIEILRFKEDKHGSARSSFML